MCCFFFLLFCFFFCQAEDGIRDLVRSRGLGDVYKRQASTGPPSPMSCRLLPRFIRFMVSPKAAKGRILISIRWGRATNRAPHTTVCLLYTSDAADERSSVDLGGRRIINKQTKARDRKSHIIKKKTQNTESSTQ